MIGLHPDFLHSAHQVFTAPATMLAYLLPVVLPFVSSVLAHGGVIGYNIGGKYYPGFVPYNSAS